MYDPDCREVRIQNLDATLQKISEMSHICSNQELLTEIRISVVEISKDLINLDASIQDFGARLDQHMSHQDKEMKETKQLVTGHSADITMLHHTCVVNDRWERMGVRIETLERESHARSGGTKWEDRLWDIGKTLFIVVATAFILFVLKGGSIF